jgi:hypothetical protein
VNSKTHETGNEYIPYTLELRIGTDSINTVSENGLEKQGTRAERRRRNVWSEPTIRWGRSTSLRVEESKCIANRYSQSPFTPQRLSITLRLLLPLGLGIPTDMESEMKVKRQRSTCNSFYLVKESVLDALVEVQT